MTKSLLARTREALPPASLPPLQIIAAISKTLLSGHFLKGPAAQSQCRRSPYNVPKDALRKGFASLRVQPPKSEFMVLL